MLVQLSPWESVETSIRVSKSTRRRRRDEGNFTEFPYSASFVASSSRRAHRKKQRSSTQISDVAPLLAITSDHRITVVGRTEDPSYQESSLLQYSSRPGSASAFLPSPQNGKSETTLPQIPALLDAKNDRVYGFQHGNTRLCSWGSLKGGGPDDKASLKLDLRQPALSVALLPMQRGILYGTCIDGSLYIARVVLDSKKGTESLSVDYFSSKESKGKQHVGTVAEIPSGKDIMSGKKRKMSDADGGVSVVFYQIFHDNQSLFLARHETLCQRESMDGGLVVDKSHTVQTASIDLLSFTVGSEKLAVCDASLLVVGSGSLSTTTILYSLRPVAPTKNGSNGTTNRRYCTSLSLAAGNLVCDPIQLPPSTEQTGLVSDSLLAAGTRDHILLVDMQSGVVVKSISVTDLVGDSTDDWLLCTDGRLAIITVLSTKDGKVQAAFSTAHLNGSTEPLSSTKVNLAAKLESSLAERSTSNEMENAPRPSIICNLLPVGVLATASDLNARMEEAVHGALKELRQTQAQIHAKGSSWKPKFLLDAFERAVATLLEDMKSCSTDIDGNVIPYNPQDALPLLKQRLLNGCVSKESTQSSLENNGLKKKPNGVNGTHAPPPSQTSTVTAESFPQSFIDGALTLVLSVLRLAPLGDESLGKRIKLAQVDAQSILRRLLHTGKVSARVHFAGLKSLLRKIELTDKEGERVYSPVDMIHDLLKYCSDVSEGQMVTMVSYLMRRALPEDVVHHMPPQHRYKVLCSQFAALSDEIEKDKATKKKLAIMRSKIIMTGTTFLLQRIVSYSECNETMLRAAMLERIFHRQEANLLAFALSDLLAKAPEVAISENIPVQNTTKATCQWINALCDSFRDELADTIASDGKSRLMSINRAIASAVSQSEAVLSLQEDIKRAEAEVESSQVVKKREKEVEEIVQAKMRKMDEEIPGYSIDHMVF